MCWVNEYWWVVFIRTRCTTSFLLLFLYIVFHFLYLNRDGGTGGFQSATFMVWPLSPDIDNRKILNMEASRRIGILVGRSEIKITVVPFLPSRKHLKWKDHLSCSWPQGQFSFLFLFVQTLPFYLEAVQGTGTFLVKGWGGGTWTKSLESEFFPLTGIMSGFPFLPTLWSQGVAMF